MKVLIVTEVFYPENFVINDFALELVARGYEVEVMTMQPSYPSGRVLSGYDNKKYSQEEWNGIVIHRFNTIEGYKDSVVKKIRKYLHFVTAGKRVIRKICHGVDSILVFQTGPLTVALPAVYAKRKFGIKTTVWTFDIWPDAVYAYGFPKIFPLTTFLNYIIKKVYKNADSVLVSSEPFAESIGQYVPEKQITYAPNWVMETDDVVSSLKLDSTKVNFMFAGNISVYQNLERTIKGFAKANIPNAMLHIVGDGSTLGQHIDLVKREGIECVVFHGHQPYSHINSLLKQSDYLVLPLYSKAGVDKTEPFKLQSYLKSGKPILGVLNGSGRAIIEKYKLGLCAIPDDIDNIAAGFQSIMLLSDDEKDRIQKRAKHLLNTRFNREVIIDKVVEVL